MTRTTILLTTLVSLALPGDALTQSLGTFRWQFRPYCNVVTVTVTQVGAIYRLEGTDDQCGGGRDLAAVQGLAFPNPDGTIGFGMTIVTVPGGAPVHVDADITMATLGGTWRDSTGGTGAFAFTTGAGTGGSVRPPPPPVAVIPVAVALAPTGSIVASGAIGAGTAPASGPGVRMMWYPGKAAFRAGGVNGGYWDELEIGTYSAALGDNVAALGLGSFAAGSGTSAFDTGSVAMGVGSRANRRGSVSLGESTDAFGANSVALGRATVAAGIGSTAGGVGTRAWADFSVALGTQTESSGVASIAAGAFAVASGDYSAAMGLSTRSGGAYSFAGGNGARSGGVGALAYGQLVFANGDGSVVLGSNAVAVPGAFGSFVFADRSTSNQLSSLNPNEFIVRAAGGARFFTNAAGTSGPYLVNGSPDWLSSSDVRLKHRFRDLDADDLLSRFARMPVTEWSYKAQDATVRHIGPTAQNFFAAFGLGSDRLGIGTLDASGVALAGVKALEARTRALQAEVEALRQQLDALIAKAPQ
ncbi:MAG: tail fiber domain-containing protein [Acidobacteria bacterium]|nr:tail fiber domain-containing protein [Acidobacteriota bacterium]